MKSSYHSFHIPVMGLGYTIDTPLKVARFGISSVISIIEDTLIEKMRKYHCAESGEEYFAINDDEPDYRARRITDYLDLMDRIVKRQTDSLRRLPFKKGNDIEKYFNLLPDGSPLKVSYHEMLKTDNPQRKIFLQDELRSKITAGSIDVNIMSKVDRQNFTKKGEPLPPEFSDAMAAFRGFAKSGLNSSVVFSAGYNPRLYSYIENFSDFFPGENGEPRKKIILKVSDFRSALIQGKLLAKKGLLISEFRIESGLNCGGHAFPTDGYLLGPILEEFSTKRNDLAAELFKICNETLSLRGKKLFSAQPQLKLTVQGGIGTAAENKFLIDYYGVNGTGWGSPFLLVPEATNVDSDTLHQLVTAKKEDYYLSHASPLGVPFNNFRRSSSEQQRKMRVEKGRPGSPCFKKFLSSDTEFTVTPICTASREYQNLKIKQVKEKSLSADEYISQLKSITEKDCLCEGLGSSVLIKDGLPPDHKLTAVVICPGPNLAYFSGVFTLGEMIDHIYGRKNILNQEERPHMFMKELQMYTDYLRGEMQKKYSELSGRQIKYFMDFKSNLLKGIDYYRSLLPKMALVSDSIRKSMEDNLHRLSIEITGLSSSLMTIG